MSGPLEGIKILEFSQIIAAPFGGMLLSDMGAEVIKIEPLDGEPWRLHSQLVPGESKTYIGLNRGKKSLPINLQTEEGKEIVNKLVVSSDVVIINARPDVPEKLGTDYESLSKINPRLIYCDNTAFGRRGPRKDSPGYDIVVQAMSGLLAADRKLVDGVPQVMSATAVADYATGLSIAWAVCAALFARERSGVGQKIDTMLLASALAVQGGFVDIENYGGAERKEFVTSLQGLRESQVPYEMLQEEQDRLGAPNIAFRIYYTTYQTATGVMAIGCLSDRLRSRAAKVIGLDDPRFKENSHADQETDDAMAALFEEAKRLIAAKPMEYWLYRFEAQGIPSGPVKFVQELLDDEQVLENDLVVKLEHGAVGPVKMVGPIVQMSKTPLKAQFASPVLGEHTDTLLLSLGYSCSDISDLKSKKIVL